MLVKGDFHYPPTELMQKSTDLKKLPENQILQLSDIVDTAKNNYVIAFETRVRLEFLQQWIKEQFALYNKGTKE